jgi:putative membrane protein
VRGLQAEAKMATDLDPLSDAGTQLASDRTAMAIERSILSEDRTLLAILRTSLSLITFGFTIYQFLGKLAAISTRVVTAESARNFGATLIVLGVILLIAGLYSHARAMAALRARRGLLYGRGLLKHPPQVRSTVSGFVSAVLLVVGLVAIAGMLLRAGPLQ